MRRFLFERRSDATGISGTGIVLEGCVLRTGRVVIEWRKPKASIGIYDSYDEFKAIHIDIHPDAGQVIWLDQVEGWTCFACGASGMDGNFCSMCGAASTHFHSAYEGFISTERYTIEKQLEAFGMRMKQGAANALTSDEWEQHRRLIDQLGVIATSGLELIPK